MWVSEAGTGLWLGKGEFRNYSLILSSSHSPLPQTRAPVASRGATFPWGTFSTTFGAPLGNQEILGWGALKFLYHPAPLTESLVDLAQGNTNPGLIPSKAHSPYSDGDHYLLFTGEETKAQRDQEQSQDSSVGFLHTRLPASGMNLTLSSPYSKPFRAPLHWD